MNPRTGQYLYRLSWIPIQRHKLVRGRHSPDDPSLQSYWQKRQQEKKPFGEKQRGQLWVRQKGRCALCQEALDNGEETHVHHIQARSEGGGNELSNLCMLHNTCHKQVHSKHGAQLKPLSAA
ncbi:MAG: HNH endonuclease [Cytophagales bacterium]|nr:HNH endonuclease [Cytophagales bacterium]